MKTIELSRVKIKPNRQRQEFDPAALVEFGDKICETGLLHAIVLRQEGEDWFLVAGERRLRVISDLHELGRPFFHDGQPVPPGHIPYTTLGELDELAAEEAEWEENNRRIDLTWQERAAATSRIADIRARLAKRDGLPAPTVSDIAREVRPNAAGIAGNEHQKTVVGEAQNATRLELIVAKHLDNPEVAKAATLKDAMKVLKRKEEEKRNAQLAATVGASFTAHLHQLHFGDGVAWLNAEEPNRFDIFLTDPIYGIGADEFGDSGGRAAGAHFYDDSYETWCRLMDGLPTAMFRAAKSEAHAYLFCDIDRFAELRSRMAAAGWEVHRTPLIWHNPDGFRTPWPEHGPQRKYELILYAMKGKRKAVKIMPDVLTYRKDPNEGHPAQKPVALLQDLLGRSARPGDKVCDPCMGSGSTIVACHELKLSCAGAEIAQHAYGLAVQRVQQLKAAEAELPGMQP